MTTHKVHRIRQHEVCALETADLTAADRRLARQLPLLELREVGPITILNPHSGVGTIRLSCATIHVRPRVDSVDWAPCVGPMLELTEVIPTAAGALHATGTTATDIWEVIAATFVRQVDALVAGGLLRRYSDATAELVAVRGRILSRETRWPERAPAVMCRYNQLTADVAENRFVLAALFQCAHLPIQRKTKGLARRLIGCFPSRIEPAASIAHHRTDRLNARYGRTLRTAEFILSTTQLGDRFGAQVTVSHLFDFDSLWEQTVLALLRAEYGTRRVRAHPASWLPGSPSNRVRAIKLEPDSVLLDRASLAPA